MTLTEVARISNLSARTKFFQVKLAVRLNDNTIAPNIDISKFVKEKTVSRLKKSIDTNDFNIGFFKETNINITVDNSENRFMEGEGFFTNGIIDGSIIRIIAGYIDPETGIAFTEMSFEGVIEGKGTVGNLKRETRKFTVLSFSSVIRKLESKSGAAVSGQTFQNAFFNMFNVAEVLRYLTVNIGNINPQVNLIIDDSTFFIGKTLQESIDALILASNSVMVLRDNEIHIVPRDESPAVEFEYFGKGSRVPGNIDDMTNQTDGTRRLITSVKVAGVTQPFNSSAFIIDRFGFKQKELDIGFITDPAKQAIIANNVLNEFQIPKQELFVSSSYIGDQLDILDLITIDNPGYIINPNPTRYNRGFKYNSGAQYGTRKGGLRYKPNIGWKVLSIDHNYSKYTTRVGVRQIGNKIGDNLIS